LPVIRAGTETVPGIGLWGVPFLRDVHGLDRAYAADHMTVMLLCFAVGSLFFGWFSDRIGRRKPLILACSYSRRDDWSIVGLCVSHHNVEDGQKDKQDAWIIFWKFPYISSN